MNTGSTDRLESDKAITDFASLIAPISEDEFMATY